MRPVSLPFLFLPPLCARPLPFPCLPSTYHLTNIAPRYTPALQSLSHALLLAPQNPFYFLQFAETALSAGDVPLALKMFLIVVDMCDRDLPTAAKDAVPTGLAVRAWVSTVPSMQMDGPGSIDLIATAVAWCCVARTCICTRGQCIGGTTEERCIRL